MRPEVKLALVVVLGMSCATAPQQHAASGEQPRCALVVVRRKEAIGTAVGAASGAAAGTAIAKDNRALGAGLGALVGGVIGNVIGRQLDQRDALALANATCDALASGTPQQLATESGLSGTVTSQPAPPMAVTATIGLKEGVQHEPTALELIEAPYIARSRVNVRGGPGTNFGVVGSFEASELLHVIGTEGATSWYFVARRAGAAGLGYVRSDLLEPTAATTNATADASPAATSTPAMDTRHLWDIRAERDRAIEVQASAQCKLVEQRVVSGGQAAQRKMKACRGPKGGWLLEEIPA